MRGTDVDFVDLNFSPDGRFLVGAAGGSAWVWEVRPDNVAYTITLDAGRETWMHRSFLHYEHKVTAVALSPDNRILALGTNRNAIWLFDRASRALLGKLEGHTNAIHRHALPCRVQSPGNTC